jgi:hypothetical protein
MVGTVTLSSLVVAGLGDWVQVTVPVVLGTVLSAIVAILLGVFDVTEHWRERRREQQQRKLREKKEREASESGDHAVEDSSRVSGDESVRDALRRLWDALRDLIDLGLSWVGLAYLFLLSAALWWLNSLMLRLGASKETARNAVLVDVMLVVLTGAWLLAGIRTRRRPIRTRLAETFVLVTVCLGAFALVAVTGSVVYGGVCVFFGGIAFLKGFS